MTNKIIISIAPTGTFVVVSPTIANGKVIIGQENIITCYTSTISVSGPYDTLEEV
jgi:hypothetical protein